MSLDDSYKEGRKNAFERKIENVYDMKISNDMKFTHDNKVNKISECNLIRDILYPSKRTKYIKSHYSSILRGFMNTRRGI